MTKPVSRDSKLKGLSSPTVAAEQELVKRSERSGSSRSRTPTNSPSNRTPRRRSSSKKDQSYDPSTGIHTSVTAIRQRSAVQRRTPPRKLERENPNGFRIRTSSNPGSNVEQLATRERGGRPRDLCVFLPPFGSPYIGGQGAWGAAQGGLGVQLGLPSLPKLPTPSHRKPALYGVANPTWRRIPPPFCASPL